MKKLAILVFLFSIFLLQFYLITVVVANPVPWNPWDSFLNLDIEQYLLIIISILCGTLVGTIFLIRRQAARPLKALVVVLTAAVISYVVGVVILTLCIIIGFTGINIGRPNPLGIIILFLTELLGTILGTLIIWKLLSISLKSSFLAMAATTLTSFLVSIIIATIYLP